jgi:cyanobactin cluster PatC/TenC/TruC protein
MTEQVESTGSQPITEPSLPGETSEQANNVPLEEPVTPTRIRRATGLVDYGFWWQWCHDHAEQSGEPFRRGLIWR